MRTAFVVFLMALSCAAQPWTMNDPAWMGQQSAPAAGGASGFTAITCDVWCGFELAGATPTTTLLNANTHFVNPSDVWATVAGTATDVLAAQHTAPQTIDTLTDSGSYGFAGDINSNGRCRLTTQATHTTISISGWYYVTTLGAGTKVEATGIFGDTMATASAGIAIKNTAGAYAAFIGGATTGADVSISAATWYYITAKVIASGACSMTVYDTSGNLVGTSTCTGGAGANNQLVMFGAGTASTSATGSIYIDNVCVDYTSAAYPLGHS